MPGKTIHAFGENGELSRGAAIALANWTLESPIGPVGPAGPVGPTGDSPAPSAAPFFVETAHLAHAVNAPSGVRAGLPATTYPDGQGFLSEHVIRVTGAAGSNVLTVDAADRATLATMVGATPNAAWGAVVAPADAPPFFTAVVATDATTVTLLRPLDRAITAAAMASRVDATGGQHLTKVATRALAWHVARFPAAIGTRGGIVEGQWDRLPASARTLWVKNAALTAYGVVNSSDGGPVIQTSLNAQPPMNPWDSEYLIARVNANTGGVRVGTHLPGHGATATLRTGRRPVVLDFWVNASRGSTLPVRSIMTRTVITADGVTVLDETDTGVGRRVLQPIYAADTITIDVTLVSGGPANIDMGQLTLREAGTGTPVGGRKIVVLGDSWSQRYDKEFGKELSVATGSTVVTHGKGGMTTDWGLAWWDDYVRQERPDTVVLCFFTNDLNNAVGGTTAPGPGGSTVTIWPSGLTAAQARARWAANLRAMVALAQRDGIRPVIIGPGLVNQGNQFPGALILETPRLVAWNATAAEVTDPASYLNTVGKTLGSSAQLGGSTVVAQGPLPADPWRNPANDALKLLQMASFSASAYTVSTGVLIGTDSNGDGLSDGLTYQDSNGPQTGDTYTPSIVGGAQRYVAVFAASGSGGIKRLRANFNVTAGREYLLIADIANATDVGSTYTDVAGAANVWTNLGGSLALTAGAGAVYVRVTADATGAKYLSIAPTAAAGATKALDLKRLIVVDLTKLLADAPNLAGELTASLAAFALGLKP